MREGESGLTWNKTRDITLGINTGEQRLAVGDSGKCFGMYFKGGIGRYNLRTRYLGFAINWRDWFNNHWDVSVGISCRSRTSII